MAPLSAAPNTRTLSPSLVSRYADSLSWAFFIFDRSIVYPGQVTKQTLGAAKTYSTGFGSDQFPADGLMGMGFKSISDYNANPPFQSMVAAGAVDESVFGFKLAESGSELYLGGTNSNLYSGDFTYVPVTDEVSILLSGIEGAGADLCASQGYWQVNMDAFNVNGKKVVSSTSSIIDTGTTLIVGDTASVKAVYAKISGSKDQGDGTWSGKLFDPPLRWL